ncbi:hypothetical protein [Gryllotalpicola protaetiae]|nr:hypothetical protein [Gryllotalpicola protaetiae]
MRPRSTAPFALGFTLTLGARVTSPVTASILLIITQVVTPRQDAKV